MTCTAELCASRFGGALRNVYGDQRHVPKRLERRLGFTARAFENWYQSISAPRMHDLVKLMAESRELEAEVLKLVAEVRART